MLCAGAATTTVYPSTNPEDVAYILPTPEPWSPSPRTTPRSPSCATTATELPDAAHAWSPSTARPDGDWVIGLDELAARGRTRLADDADLVRRRVDAIRPDQLATLIYTSGTTGRPKGVRLTQDCWVYEGVRRRRARAADARTTCSTSGCRCRTSFGKVLLAAQLATGSAAAVDGRVDKIIDNLAVVSPTFMAAVPRIFEKVYGRVVDDGRGGGRRASRQDLRLGDRRRSRAQHGHRRRAGTPAAGPQGQARGGRPAGLRQAARALRRAAAVPGLAAAPRCRRTSPSSSTPPAS